MGNRFEQADVSKDDDLFNGEVTGGHHHARSRAVVATAGRQERCGSSLRDQRIGVGGGARQGRDSGR